MAAESTVLLFAYHFPPEAEIGAARPYRFYTYLTQLGYSCKVITAAKQGDTPLPGVTYIPDLYFTAPRQGFRWQLERAFRWGVLPGVVGMGWSLDAARVARDILRKERPARAIVISTFPPMGVHFAASRLAREEGLPWIADFRDPLDPEGMNPSSGLSPFKASLCRWLEKKFIRSADAVIANTDANQQKWQREYPDRTDKIHLIWNGFDPERRIAAKPLPQRPYKVLCHTGTLYTGRSVGPILSSINRLIERQTIPQDALRIRLVGETESLKTLGAEDVVKRAQSQGWLELPGIVPPAESREIMQTSDYLLLIQQQSNTQVPGKLFEYLQTGRPILAFIRPNSPTERILVGSGIPHRCIYPDDSPERMDQVIAEFLKLPTDATPASSWFEDQFNGKTQTRALAAIIDSMNGSVKQR